MNYLHYEFDLSPGECVEVTLDKQANVRLLDSHNYSLYREGKEHKYRGGLAKKSPVILAAPSKDRWHVVVDLGGYAGTVHASAKVLQGV